MIFGMVTSLLASKLIVYAATEQGEISDNSVEAFDEKEVLQLSEEKNMPIMN